MPLRKEVDLEKTVAAASGVFRDVCSEEPPYHTAEELWEGLKQGRILTMQLEPPKLVAIPWQAAEEV